MPIDTRDKRGSVLGVRVCAPRVEQNPAASIAQSGRQIAAYVYSGILAATPSVFLPAWAMGATNVVGPATTQPVIR